MQKLFLIFFLVNAIIKAQTIKIVSSKDKSPIPFCFVSIKSTSGEITLLSEANGIIALKSSVIDSTKYNVSIKSIGFKPFQKVFLGSELTVTKVIELVVDQLQLDEVVVTAQYQPTSAEKAVQRIKVIDKQKIDQMGAVNLRDVLTNQLNVRLQQDNVLGSGMSCQGVSGENVKILMDGVPMIGRLNGNIDLSQINLNNIERIEIIEGPLSVQYGTNALAGTINLITRKPNQKKCEAGATSYYESIGTYNANLNFSVSKGKQSVIFNAGRNYFDGWISDDKQFIFPKSKIADSTRFKQWKPREQYFADAAYQLQLKKMNVGLKSGLFNEKIINRGYPKAPYVETSFDDYYYTKRIDNSLSLNGKLSKNWNIQSVSAYNIYNRIKKTVYKDLTTLNETPTTNTGDQDTTGFNLFMSRASFSRTKDSTKFNYEAGYDVNYESAIGKRIENQLQSMGDYALFATMEYAPVKALVFKVGGRAAYNTVYKAPVIPSLNIKYSINNKHTIRASFAQGFRAPSIKELYFYFVDVNHNIIGNQNLKAETSNNFMCSYNYLKRYENSSTRLDYSLFYNDISNLITLAQINGVEYSYVNIGKYKTWGQQLTVNYHYKQLNVQLGGSLIGRYNQLSETENINKFNYSPEVVSNASYNFSKIKTTLSLFYKYNGKLPNLILVNNEVQQNFIQDYHIADATIDKQLFKNKIRITIGCKNLFNVTNILANVSGGAHSSNSGSIAMATGRNYFVKLSFNIDKLIK
jgi:outer membrane receptor for ferrienterochelin and colicins